MQFYVVEVNRTGGDQEGEKRFHVTDVETLNEIHGTWGEEKSKGSRDISGLEN